MTLKQYETKLGNLASLMTGFQVIGLQETGGRDEIAALAARSGMKWVWERGNDTATGQEVGLLHNLPGWQVSSRGRVRELDRTISKHLLVETNGAGHRVLFLVVNLLRPIGIQVAKHKQQLAVVGEWMTATAAKDSKAVVVVLGDSNSAVTDASISLFGVGTEAGAQIAFKGTHLTNRAFDRLVLLGPAAWQAVEIRRPPYGNRPVSDVKRVWTDHYLLGATLHLP